MRTCSLPRFRSPKNPVPFEFLLACPSCPLHDSILLTPAFLLTIYLCSLGESVHYAFLFPYGARSLLPFCSICKHVHSHSLFPRRFCSLTRIFCFFRIYVPWEPMPTRTDCSPPIPVRPGGCPLSSLARLRISVPLSSLSAAPTRSLRVVAHYHEMFPRMSCSPGAATRLPAPHQPSA